MEGAELDGIKGITSAGWRHIVTLLSAQAPSVTVEQFHVLSLGAITIITPAFAVWLAATVLFSRYTYTRQGITATNVFCLFFCEFHP